MAHILVVDDDPVFCAAVDRLLTGHGHRAETVLSGRAALSTLHTSSTDLVLLDLQMAEMDGLETLRRLRQAKPDLPVLMMTGAGGVEAAVSAIKGGAADFVTKPLDVPRLLQNIRWLLAGQETDSAEGPDILGSSEPFQEALDLLHRMAVPEINVVLRGDTGTGKELFARRLHARSKRRSGPFVAVDCSVLPEHLFESELFGHERGAFTGAVEARTGRLEMAQGGTLFLDEIGNLPLAQQAKLLRVIQERRFERVGGREAILLDLRLVAATNVDLIAAVRAGAFREDLYYRLNEVTITLPPLRQRRGDVELLARHFIERHAARMQRPAPDLSPEALELLERHRWPGNVRELESAMKSAVVLATGVVRPGHLPAGLGGGHRPAETLDDRDDADDSSRLRVSLDVDLSAGELDLKSMGAAAVEQAERALLRALVRDSTVSRAKLARRLNVDPKTLRAKLRKYGLQTGSPLPNE